MLLYGICSQGGKSRKGKGARGGVEGLAWVSKNAGGRPRLERPRRLMEDIWF